MNLDVKTQLSTKSYRFDYKSKLVVPFLGMRHVANFSCYSDHGQPVKKTATLDKILAELYTSLA